MRESKTFLTTTAYADQASVSKTTVLKWLKEGKIKGEKVGNRWMIFTGQTIKASSSPMITKPARVPHASDPSPEKRIKSEEKKTKTYSVGEFSAMTYLTEFGVEQWLRKGRLKGTKDGFGTWKVDADNLDLPYIKGLLRRQRQR